MDFSSPPSEVYYKGEVRLASSVDVALVIIAFAAIDRIATWIHAAENHPSPSPPRVSLVPSIICLEGYLAVFVLGGGIP